MSKNFLQSFCEIFYKKKYRDGYYIYRILFFKFKKIADDVQMNLHIQEKDKIVKLPIPNIKNIGRYSYGSINTFTASPNTKMGAFCSLGNNVVLGHGKHPMNYLSTSPYFYFENLGYKNPEQVAHEEFWDLEPIEIGNDVWIGDGVFVKNGVKIGDGAILGARAVVTKDVPPYAIVVGSPAKILRYRFDEETIKTLLELKWWELDDEIIKQIPYDDINKAIEFIKEVRNR